MNNEIRCQNCSRIINSYEYDGEIFYENIPHQDIAYFCEDCGELILIEDDNDSCYIYSPEYLKKYPNDAWLKHEKYLAWAIEIIDEDEFIENQSDEDEFDWDAYNDDKRMGI